MDNLAELRRNRVFRKIEKDIQAKNKKKRDAQESVYKKKETEETYVDKARNIAIVEGNYLKVTFYAKTKRNNRRRRGFERGDYKAP